MDYAVILVITATIGLGVAIGFWWGRGTRSGLASKAIPDVYVQGLNYLLSERQDEAVEVFLEALRQHPESVDILLALGRQFRRRGELERALRVHQYLLEQPALALELRQSVLFEIARDYLKAGILDRAESILKELLESQPTHGEGLATLAELYELGGEWASSITIRKRLLREGTSGQRSIIAMLYGELAEQSLQKGDRKQAREYLDAAQKQAPEDPRALILSGRMAFEEDRWQEALKQWQKLLDWGAESAILLVLEPFLRAARQLGTEGQNYKSELQEHCQSALAVKLLAQALLAVDGLAVATEFLQQVLLRQPNLRVFQILLNMGPVAPAPALFDAIAVAVRDWQSEPELFQCQSCGYQSSRYYWHCPGCRQWGTFSGEHRL